MEMDLQRNQLSLLCMLLGASEITAHLYCNCVYLYWKGFVIFSLHLR